MFENTVPKMASVGDVAIAVSHVSKIYKLYPSHQDRLKEALHPFRKRYHEEFAALKDVSFEIRRGESVGILGRNGAGKSTLLQLIAGVLHPTSGTVKVAGTISALLELGAGFNPDLTGRENVLLANTIQGVDEKEIAERVLLVEYFADVGFFFDQPMKVYSSGMYARVAFAHAININPDVLIVDEILGVGDAKFQEKCYSRIRAMREAGVCILFVSHSTEIVQRNCDKALLIEGGKLIAHDCADAVIAVYHDLLYGSGRTEISKIEAIPLMKKKEALVSGAEKRVIGVELKEFINVNDAIFCNEQNYYNPNERRFGNGAAKVIDLIVTADEQTKFDVLSGNETLRIYLKVRFEKDIAKPQIGWAIVSQEGIVMAGSNTFISNLVLPKAQLGEIWVYEIEIQPDLCGGDYFLNLGVGEIENETWTFLDNRRSVIHLTVADDDKATGFFRLPFTCRQIAFPIRHD